MSFADVPTKRYVGVVVMIALLFTYSTIASVVAPTPGKGGSTLGWFLLNGIVSVYLIRLLLRIGSGKQRAIEAEQGLSRVQEIGVKLVKAGYWLAVITFFVVILALGRGKASGASIGLAIGVSFVLWYPAVLLVEIGNYQARRAGE
jgi:hypothetical protein